MNSDSGDDGNDKIDNDNNGNDGNDGNEGPALVDRLLAAEEIEEINKIRAKPQLPFKYVPDGSMFAQVVKFDYINGVYTASYIMLDAHSIHMILQKRKVEYLLICHSSELSYGPPTKIYYYALIEGEYESYTAELVYKLKVFRNDIIRVFKRLEKTKSKKPVYMIKITEGIVVPFDEADRLLFKKIALINMDQVIVKKKAYDEFAPAHI